MPLKRMVTGSNLRGGTGRLCRSSFATEAGRIEYINLWQKWIISNKLLWNWNVYVFVTNIVEFVYRNVPEAILSWNLTGICRRLILWQNCTFCKEEPMAYGGGGGGGSSDTCPPDGPIKIRQTFGIGTLSELWVSKSICSEMRRESWIAHLSVFFFSSSRSLYVCWSCSVMISSFLVSLYSCSNLSLIRTRSRVASCRGCQTDTDLEKEKLQLELYSHRGVRRNSSIQRSDSLVNSNSFIFMQFSA